MRTYPDNLRQDSSNYNPTMSWSLGAQVAALNYQTNDWPMFINQGKFRANGHSGYVLKPAWLRDEKKNKTQQVSSGKLCIKPLFGRCFTSPQATHDQMKEMPSMKLKLSVHGLEQANTPISDEVTMHETTAVYSDKEGNYVWMDKNGVADNAFVFNFHHVEMAMLLVEVDECGSSGLEVQTICQIAIPVLSLKNGIRSIPLYDTQSCPALASIVCDIKLTAQGSVHKNQDVVLVSRNASSSHPVTTLIYPRVFKSDDDIAELGVKRAKSCKTCVVS